MNIEELEKEPYEINESELELMRYVVKESGRNLFSG